jgi:hypothetical protein
MHGVRGVRIQDLDLPTARGVGNKTDPTYRRREASASMQALGRVRADALKRQMMDLVRSARKSSDRHLSAIVSALRL